MQKYIAIALLTFSFLLGNEADHIIFTQITITPDEGELIVIHNPTNESIPLSNYYLSDAESQGKKYYNLPTGSDYWSGYSSDFIARFPDINIGSGETITISIKDASTFNNSYSYDPDYTLTDDMLDAVDGENTIGLSANLADNYESLILFYWDGSSSIVQDVDYFYWGNTQALDLYGIDKTGVSTYLDDTPFNIQAGHTLEAHDSDYSYVRKSTTETGENGPSNNVTGNGITGHDETSEIFNESWEIIFNPLLPTGCTDNTACNYMASAAYDDGTCLYPEEYYDCDGNCLLDDDEDGICNIFEVYGCMDEDAVNYVEEAEFDNGTCNIEASLTIQQILEEEVGVDSEGDCDNDDEITPQPTIIALVVGYDDKRPSNGPQVVVLQDANGYQMDLIVFDDFDVLDSNIGFMFDPYDPSEYMVYVDATVGAYNCSWQIQPNDPSQIKLYNVFHPDGDFIKDDSIIKTEIKPEPYVIIPSIGERLDFEYSFPSNSRVTIRIFDLDGRFITSIIDRFYGDAGTVTRMVDGSDWDGRDHLSQIVDPGTYLIHIEATNYLTGESSSDIAPIVVGVNY